MFSFPPLTPVVKKLLIGFLGFFVLELLLQVWAGLPVFELLALSPTHVGLHTLWQLATYVLVWPADPGSVLWVLIGLVFLWWIMAPFEARFGPRRTVQLAVVTALSASLPALAAGVLFPQGQPLYGFNPILIGTIAGFAWALRGRGTLMLFGVVPMRPVHIIWLVVGVSLLFFLSSQNFLDLIADLGAVGGGVGFVHWMTRPPSKPRPKRSARKQAPFSVIEGGGGDEPPRWLN